MSAQPLDERLTLPEQEESNPARSPQPVGVPAPLGPADPFMATGLAEWQAASAALTATGPVHRILLPTGAPAWLIIGYDEVRGLGTDPRLVQVEPWQRPPGGDELGGELPPALDAAMNTCLLHLNPPDHTRLRRLTTAAFTHRRIDRLAPRIQQLTDELLDKLEEAGEVDLIPAFASPLPITVIGELLGVPSDRQADFRDWSTTIVAGLRSESAARVAAATALIGYVRELIAAKRAAPADDLLSALVGVGDGADQLSEDELTSMVFVLLVGGHETTVNLIDNGVHALLTHPNQLALLRAAPERLPAAVEDLLRFDRSLQLALLRWTTAPVRIGVTVIPAGELVVLGLPAADPDRSHNADPDVLDLTRADNPHLAFGHDIHHCLGAPLARLAGRIALGSLLSRFPQLRLAVPAPQLTWQPGVLLHGLTALPVIMT